MRLKEFIKKHKRERRVARSRAKIHGTAERPRLSVTRTNDHIYAQVIDDDKGVTLASAHSKKVDQKKKKLEQALEVGKLLAENAKAANINKVVFDRRGRAYHGRVKAVAEGAREGGLEF